MRAQTMILVALGDIAAMAMADAGESGEDASKRWMERAKKWADRGLLPAPVAHTSGGRIWLRADILHWLEERK